jgi:hypothetical protein
MKLRIAELENGKWVAQVKTDLFEWQSIDRDYPTDEGRPFRLWKYAQHVTKYCEVDSALEARNIALGYKEKRERLQQVFKNPKIKRIETYF